MGNLQKDWERWADHKNSLHHSVGRKAGIFDAVMNSTNPGSPNEDQIFRFGEKWCPEANTFNISLGRSYSWIGIWKI